MVTQWDVLFLSYSLNLLLQLRTLDLKGVHTVHKNIKDPREVYGKHNGAFQVVLCCAKQSRIRKCWQNKLVHRDRVHYFLPLKWHGMAQITHSSPSSSQCLSFMLLESLNKLSIFSDLSLQIERLSSKLLVWWKVLIWGTSLSVKFGARQYPVEVKQKKY